MGANSSVINEVTNNTYNISDTAVKVLNQNINSAISNSMVKAAQNCSSSAFTSQNFDIDHASFYDGLNITDFQQDATDFVSFNCIQNNQIKNISNDAIVSELMGQMSLKFSNAALSEIAQAGAARAAAGGIPGLSQSANSNVSNIIFNNVHNEVNTNITMEQIVKNTVEQNFNAETVANCISNINVDQHFAISNTEVFGAPANITGFRQDAGIESLTSCAQKNSIVNQTTTELLTNLGFKIDQENNNFGSYASNQKGGSETETSGPLAGLWGTLQSLIGNYSESIIVVVVLSCICCMFILWLIFRGGGDSDSDDKPSKSKSSKSKSPSKSSDLDDDDDINDVFADDS